MIFNQRHPMYSDSKEAILNSFNNRWDQGRRILMILQISRVPLPKLDMTRVKGVVLL